jgi:hypothetical protein
MSMLSHVYSKIEIKEEETNKLIAKVEESLVVA